MLHQVPQISATTPLDDFMSFLCCPTPREPTPSNLTPSSSPFEFLSHHPSQASSHSTTSNQLSPDVQRLLAILRHSSIQTMVASGDSPGLTDPHSPSSNSAEQLPLHENAITSSTPDSVIDPALLDISHTHYSDLVNPSVNSTGQDPPTPTPLQSPITSTSSFFGPLTPREDLYSEPDVHPSEQGTLQLSSRFFQAPQARAAPIGEDPIRAATLLLQALISAPSQATQSKAQSQPPPSRFLSGELQVSNANLTSRTICDLDNHNTPNTQCFFGGAETMDGCTHRPTFQGSFRNRPTAPQPGFRGGQSTEQTRDNTACKGTTTAAHCRAGKGEGGALGGNNRTGCVKPSGEGPRSSVKVD
ncbi:hypothetical protein EDB92DRAFT_244856 [Lactarius akahatsu]|uniref:Uncharacterized protein n=1 Tax=Lactarius akahatsu TaxID=416441 RepID=A0AAD4LJ29_9AGAM|nr:hypothetical protein EDB92DRAFT_244856 [Lactarius akahatsu]